MDVMRRFGGGELSEILGDETVKLDREQKVLGFAQRQRNPWK